MASCEHICPDLTASVCMRMGSDILLLPRVVIGRLSGGQTNLVDSTVIGHKHTPMLLEQYQEHTHEYADSMSMYSLPSGSHTLVSRVSKACPWHETRLVYSLGALRAFKDHGERVIAT